MLTSASSNSEFFGQWSSSESVSVFTRTNRRGIKLRAINDGATVLSPDVPDLSGPNGDVLLGFNTMSEYLVNSPFFGAVMGRYANRIACGRFALDGEIPFLALNHSPRGIPCALHGGLRGFDKVFWAATFVNHEVIMNADAFTPVNQGMIPTGEILPVAGTSLD